MFETVSTGADLGPWRGRLGWSVPRAADELRILAPSLRNLESGRKTASGALLRLAEALEQLECAPAPVAMTEVSRTASRKPRARKPTPLVPSDPFEAAVRRAGIRHLSEEALSLLRAAVERRLAGYCGGRHGMPAVGEDLVVWRQRQAAWHAAVGGEFRAPLDVVAGLVMEHLPA